MKSQKIIDGTARNSIVFLHPISAVNDPNVKTPRMPPIHPIDPIQESCSLVITPLSSGVSFDINLGKDGDNQPTMHP